MKKEGRTKENRGITLIALIVTIIVLLILSGISIAMLTGQNGILNRGAEAKTKTSRTQIIELARLDILAKQAENRGNITNSDLRTILTEYFSDVPETLPESEEELEELELTSIGSNHKIKVGEIWKGATSGETKLPQTEGTKPYLPSSDFTQVVGTDLDTGLVIEDKIGNQYVWIEVPTTLYNNTSYNTETTTGDKMPKSETDYENIEYCLHQYTMVYRKGKQTEETSYRDVYFEDTSEGWYKSEEDYNKDKQKMLKSVYENGGFWIGRYEAGIDVNRTSEGEANVTPKSKENLYPYTYVTRTQAQVLAKQVNSGKYTSSLMYGVQWDLVLKYIETKAVEHGVELANIQAEINLDSKSWGNYNDATFRVNKGKYSIMLMEPYGLSETWNEYTYNMSGYVENQNKLSIEQPNGLILTTGATDATKKQNIYDLAGNVSEWTLEGDGLTNGSTATCVYRGGYYGPDYGYDMTASTRPGGAETGFAGFGFNGFRVAFY